MSLLEPIEYLGAQRGSPQTSKVACMWLQAVKPRRRLGRFWLWIRPRHELLQSCTEQPVAASHIYVVMKQPVGYTVQLDRVGCCAKELWPSANRECLLAPDRKCPEMKMLYR